MLRGDSVLGYEEINLHSVLCLLAVFGEEELVMPSRTQHLGDDVLYNHATIELQLVSEKFVVKAF